MRQPLRIRFAAPADAQLFEAKRWWRQHRSAAADLLHDAVEKALDELSVSPNIGRPARDVDLVGIRCFRLNRVPYNLYYRVVDEEWLEILAVHHIRRGSPPKL